MPVMPKPAIFAPRAFDKVDATARDRALQMVMSGARKSRRCPDRRLRKLRKPKDRFRRTPPPFLRCRHRTRRYRRCGDVGRHAKPQRSPARLDCSRVALRSSQCRSRYWYLAPVSRRFRANQNWSRLCFRIVSSARSPRRPAVNFRHNACSIR